MYFRKHVPVLFEFVLRDRIWAKQRLEWSRRDKNIFWEKHVVL